MIKINSNSNGFSVEGVNNVFHPDNGTLVFATNTVTMLIDESDMVTFRSAANNDVLFSGLIGEIQIGGETVTKQNIITKFDAVANSASGGGGGGDLTNYYTKSETNALLDDKADVSDIPTELSDLTNDVGYITQSEVIINESFPSSWLQAQDMEDLIAAINNDSDAVVGKVYMDTISLSDLPASMLQAEVKAEIMSELSGEKVILFTVTSSNTAPYHWEYTSAYGETGTWREWAVESELADYFDGAEYDSNTKRINFKHGNTVKTYIDATAFIKDGMVDTVAISNGNLVITFNTDAGKQPISIPLTDIFNPANYYDKTATDTLLAAKADSSSLATVATSGSYNDLSNKPTIPAAQVQSDWTQSDNTQVDFIKNKPSLATVATSGSYNDLSNTPTIPVVPTNVSAFTNDAGYLTQHQSLANYYTKSEVDTELADKQDKLTAGTNITIDANNVISATGGGSVAQIQSDWTQSDDTKVDYIKHKPTLATVATSGSYNDLSNTPTIPVVPTNVSAFTNDAGYLTQHQSLSNYYTKTEVDAELNTKQDTIDSTHKLDYSLLSNTPTIPTVPTNVSAFTNDAGYLTQHQSLANYYTKTETDSTFLSKTEFATKEEVISTALNDLDSGKQDVLTAGANITITNNVISATGGGGGTQVQSDWTQTDDTQVDYIKHKPTLATVATSGSYNDLSNTPTIPAAQVQSDWSQSDNTQVDFIKNKPSLATVATSGSYNDLSDKPTIPDVSDYVEKSVFNQKEIAIANALTELHDEKVDASDLATVATSGSYNDLSNKPSIPAAQIQSDWNQSDSAALDYIKNKPTIPDTSTFMTKSEFAVKEEVISTAFNDLNNKMGDIETILASI